MNIYPKQTIPNLITKGKKYIDKKVILLNKYYLINADDGSEKALPKVLFISEQEQREQTINDILE